MKSIGHLRPVLNSDLELMLTWRNAPSVRENMYTRHEIRLEEHQKWWASIRDDDAHRYLMYESDGVPQGVVSFNEIDIQNGHAFWAFYSDPSAPRGTGMRMELLALDYAFDVLGLHKLSCEVLDYNRPVIKLHQKFGFIEEGLFRDHHKVEDGFVSVHRLALMDSGWSEKRQDLLERIKRLVEKS